MGADIYFGKQKNIYFRDSYNVTNLAWVIGMSYWEDFKKDPNKFIKVLSKIDDGQIDRYVKELPKKKQYVDFSKQEMQQLAKTLKGKRDELRKIIKGRHKVEEFSI